MSTDWDQPMRTMRSFSSSSTFTRTGSPQEIRQENRNLIDWFAHMDAGKRDRVRRALPTLALVKRAERKKASDQ